MISNIHVKQDFCLFADTNIHTLSRCWDLEAKCHLIHFSCLPLLLFPSRGVICPEHELKLGLMLHTPCFIYVSYSRKVLVSLSSSTCIYRAPSTDKVVWRQLYARDWLPISTLHIFTIIAMYDTISGFYKYNTPIPRHSGSF